MDFTLMVLKKKKKKGKKSPCRFSDLITEFV